MMNVNSGESQLLESLKRGDSETFFNLIHDQFAWQIISWANNYDLGNSFEAEDVLQAVFIKIVSGKNIDYFKNCKSIGKIRAIIWTATHNYCKTQYKNARKRQTENIDELQVALTMNPQAEKNLFGEDMQMLLNQISEKRKDVIFLKMSGFKYKEIAKELGIKESAAKNRYHHGIKGLRELYPKYFKD